MQLRFQVTEISVFNNTLYVSPPIILYSWSDIQNKIQLVFPNQSTYLTKEENSNESLIQSTTDETTFLHILELV